MVTTTRRLIALTMATEFLAYYGSTPELQGFKRETFKTADVATKLAEYLLKEESGRPPVMQRPYGLTALTRSTMPTPLLVARPPGE